MTPEGNQICCTTVYGGVGLCVRWKVGVKNIAVRDGWLGLMEWEYSYEGNEMACDVVLLGCV